MMCFILHSCPGSLLLLYLETALRQKDLIFNQKPINRLAPLIGTGVFVDLYHYC